MKQEKPQGSRFPDDGIRVPVRPDQNSSAISISSLRE